MNPLLDYTPLYQGPTVLVAIVTLLSSLTILTVLYVTTVQREAKKVPHIRNTMWYAMATPEQRRDARFGGQR